MRPVLQPKGTLNVWLRKPGAMRLSERPRNKRRDSRLKSVDDRRSKRPRQLLRAPKKMSDPQPSGWLLV
jgi:hypothetical protein